jgi:hypothetical protein
MVSIFRTDTETLFELKGLHKFLAFKSSLTIPNSHIIGVYQDSDEINNWSGIRALGTHIPFLLKAGSFYSDPDNSAVFMDIVNASNAIIIVLRDEKYQKLIIEVEDPLEAISILSH